MADLGQYAANAYAELAREREMDHRVITVADVIAVVVAAVEPAVRHRVRQAILRDKELCSKMSPGTLTEVLRRIG